MSTTQTYSERIEIRKRHNAVRDWLNSLPGTFEFNDSAEECWRLAWGACGVANVGIEEFKNILKVYGLGPVEPLGGKYVLRLPGRPMAATNQSDRLRNIVR